MDDSGGVRPHQAKEKCQNTFSWGRVPETYRNGTAKRWGSHGQEDVGRQGDAMRRHKRECDRIRWCMLVHATAEPGACKTRRITYEYQSAIFGGVNYDCTVCD